MANTQTRRPTRFRFTIGFLLWLVAYIQPPPSATSSARQVVSYFTRYLTGGPISDHRIVAADTNEVTFMAREGKRIGGEREQIPVTFKTPEFVRRWSLHIQPDQLTKTRYLGGWANNRRSDYLHRCGEQLAAVGLSPSEQHPIEASQEEIAEVPDLLCEHCGCDRMELIAETPKPSWKELFWREDERCPGWYAERERESHGLFWTESYGRGFYDWYLETQVEGAKEIEPEPSRPMQLSLLDFAASDHHDKPYLLDSF